MRTKATILSAVALAAGLVSSHAQVYSANVVGYVNIVCSNQYTLIENPLDATANGGNTVSNVLNTIPAGNAILKFNGSTFLPNNLDLFGGGWDLPNDPLAPGTGFFVQNQQGSPFTITFVGTVLQGLTTNNLANGYTLVGSQTPKAAFIGDLGFAGNPGDYVFKFKNGSFVQYVDDLFGGGWSSGSATDVDNVKGPFLNVGESFFYNNQNGTPVQWINNFTVQ